MSISLSKGQKISLSKEVNGLSKVMVGLGWDAAKKKLFAPTPNIDCDASAILLAANDMYRDCIYYGNLSGASDCVRHHGDNLTGDGNGDDEQITIDLKNMPVDIEKIIFAVNIYNCTAKHQNFGMIKNAFIRLVNAENQKEICRYDLSSENYDDKTAMIFAEVYKHNNEWKFNAIGQGTNDTGISSIINRYK